MELDESDDDEDFVFDRLVSGDTEEPVLFVCLNVFTQSLLLANLLLLLLVWSSLFLLDKSIRSPRSFLSVADKSSLFREIKLEIVFDDDEVVEDAVEEEHDELD